MQFLINLSDANISNLFRLPFLQVRGSAANSHTCRGLLRSNAASRLFPDRREVMLAQRPADLGQFPADLRVLRLLNRLSIQVAQRAVERLRCLKLLQLPLRLRGVAALLVRHREPIAILVLVRRVFQQGLEERDRHVRLALLKSEPGLKRARCLRLRIETPRLLDLEPNIVELPECEERLRLQRQGDRVLRGAL